MKKVLFAILALASTSVAMADSLVGQRPVTEISGHYYGTHYVTTVDNYGHLSVREDRGGAMLGEKRLHAQTAQKINELAYLLANAKVKTTRSDFICRMVAPPAFVSSLKVSGLDHQSRLFSGRLRHVLGEEGCWVSVHTAPVDPTAHAAARQLKSLLEVLTLEVSGLTERR